MVSAKSQRLSIYQCPLCKRLLLRLAITKHYTSFCDKFGKTVKLIRQPDERYQELTDH